VRIESEQALLIGDIQRTFPPVSRYASRDFFRVGILLTVKKALDGAPTAGVHCVLYTS
jgi:hypothetical protein